MVTVVVFYYALVIVLFLYQPTGFTFYLFSSPSLRESVGEEGSVFADGLLFLYATWKKLWKEIKISIRSQELIEMSFLISD